MERYSLGGFFFIKISMYLPNAFGKFIPIFEFGQAHSTAYINAEYNFGFRIHEPIICIRIRITYRYAVGHFNRLVYYALYPVTRIILPSGILRFAGASAAEIQ